MIMNTDEYERQKANRLAKQIIGEEPIDRHVVMHKSSSFTTINTIDLQSVEKCVIQITRDFCYLKRVTDSHYREPTRAAVRSWILKWIHEKKLENRVVPIKRGPGVVRAGRPTERVVDPRRVRFMFLSHKKYDLKINQPGWQGPMRDARGVCPKRGKYKRGKLTLIQRIFRLIKKILGL